ncbi:MAG: agglutinin biogenesis protein MshP [Pseudomonadota bacterium]
MMQRSRGFGLITAIFLLVVLAGLGAAIVNVFNTQQSSSSLDEQGDRALQAARAGIEWGLYVQMQPSAASCFSATSFKMPASTVTPPVTSVLAPFTVTVVCTAASTPVGSIVRRQIRATACNQPAGSGAGTCPNPNASADYVQRMVQVEF